MGLLAWLSAVLGASAARVAGRTDGDPGDATCRGLIRRRGAHAQCRARLAAFAQRDWLALPRQLDRFLADHFGLRSELVRAHGRLRYAMDLPSDLRVIIGRDNWLFLNGDGTIEQATGMMLREAAIAQFADRAAALRAQLAAKGADFWSRSRRTARPSIARACPPGPPRRLP